MKSVLFLLIGNIRYDGRVQKEIATLKNAGYNVTLIVSMFDNDDDIRNYDFNIIIQQRKNGGSFLIKFFRTFFYFFKMRKHILQINPDILHCNDLNTLFFSYKLPKDISIIYDAHELYFESRKGFTRAFLAWTEKYLIQNAKKVIVPQIDRLYYMYFRYNLPMERFSLIENFPLKKANLSKSFYYDKYTFKKGYNLIISYLGTVQKEREIDLIVQAMQEIQGAVLFIIGNGEKKYVKEIQNLIYTLQLEEKVFLMPAIPQEEVLSAINSSDIGVCFYNAANFNSYFCASNKLYEYLDCGVKLLTNNIAGVVRVVKHGVNGYCCDYINKESIVDGINTLLKTDEIKKENYYWENQIPLFLSLYV
jgi:glycosyltransferase involved in cell wall biosynthesis